MTKFLSCNYCNERVAGEKFDNPDGYLYHCPKCMSVLYAETYEGEPLEINELLFFSSTREQQKEVPCQCGEGYLYMSPREIRELIEETSQQIESLTTAAEELLYYKQTLEVILRSK